MYDKDRLTDAYFLTQSLPNFKSYRRVDGVVLLHPSRAQLASDFPQSRGVAENKEAAVRTRNLPHHRRSRKQRMVIDDRSISALRRNPFVHLRNRPARKK